MTATATDIYAEGYQAFQSRAAKFIELNPYNGGKEWILWRRGWQQAYRDHVAQWRKDRTDSRD